MKKISTNLSYQASKVLSSSTFDKINEIKFDIGSDFNKNGDVLKPILGISPKDIIIKLPKDISVIENQVITTTSVPDPFEKFPSINLDVNSIKSALDNNESAKKQKQEELFKKEEEYDITLPRAEIISLTEFFPLYNDNDQTTVAGKHFKYQLLYLNANKFIINKQLKNYLSQDKKDTFYKNEFSELLRLVDDNSLNKNESELYTKEYFNTLLKLNDYSVNEIIKFWSNIDFKKEFSNYDKKQIIDLLKKANIKLNNLNLRKLYALLCFSLDEKIYTKKYVLGEQKNDLIIYFNSENQAFINKKEDYNNLVINDTKFNLKIPYENSNEIFRSDKLVNLLIYESFKDKNKSFINNDLDILNIKTLELKDDDYSEGKSLSLLTNFGDSYLITENEDENYLTKIFNDSIGTGFSNDVLKNIGSTTQRKSIQGFENIKSRLDKRLISIIQGVDPINDPPTLDIYFKYLLNNFNKLDFKKYSNNLSSIEKTLKNIVSYYYETIQGSYPLQKVGFDGNVQPINYDNFNLVIGDFNNNNNDKIKSQSAALRLIHFGYASNQGHLKWTKDLKVSTQYVPYDQGQENIQNLLGFLTYLYKRTSKKPGQLDYTNLSIDVDDDSNKINEKISGTGLLLKPSENGQWWRYELKNNNGKIEQSYWMCFNELLKSLADPESEFSSLKNPFYKKFADSYVELCKIFDLKDLTLGQDNFSYKGFINKKDEELFLMFHIFIFLVDTIKSLFNYTCEIRWTSVINDPNRDFFTNNGMITRSRNCIGLGSAGVLGWGNTIFFTNLNENLKAYATPPNWNDDIRRYQEFFNIYDIVDSGQPGGSDNDEDYWRYWGNMNAISLKFDIKNQIKELNSRIVKWREDFENTKNIYNFLRNKISIANESITYLKELDYDFLSYIIDPSFKLDKKSFFTTRFQLNELKLKNNIVNKQKIDDYIIEEIYDDKYEYTINKSLSIFKDSSKNAKILTFAIPKGLQSNNDIIVSVYRKNLIYTNLKFKPIQFTFNQNLFCSILNLFEINNDLNVDELIKNSKFYLYKKNKLSFDEVNSATLPFDIVKNHFYSEVFNQYNKIMTGLDINESTMIEKYPVLDCGDTLQNISKILNHDASLKEKMLTIRNKISTFSNPLDLRQFLFSNSIFERIFSILIDPDDFELDTENWLENYWVETQQIGDYVQYIPTNATPFRFKNLNGKYYLLDDNVTDSYKIKIDKKVYNT